MSPGSTLGVKPGREEQGMVAGAATAGLEQWAINHFSCKEKLPCRVVFTDLVLISYHYCTREAIFFSTREGIFRLWEVYRWWSFSVREDLSKLCKPP